MLSGNFNYYNENGFELVADRFGSLCYPGFEALARVVTIGRPDINQKSVDRQISKLGLEMFDAEIETPQGLRVVKLIPRLAGDRVIQQLNPTLYAQMATAGGSLAYLKRLIEPQQSVQVPVDDGLALIGYPQEEPEQESYSSEAADFNIENGHARLSQRKVAELLGVAQQNISKAIHRSGGDILYTVLEVETISRQGFDGDTLSKLVVYYAFDSRQASSETKQRCKEMVLKTSAKGFQDFIDAIAGIPQQQATEQPLTTENQNQDARIVERAKIEIEELLKMLELCRPDPLASSRYAKVIEILNETIHRHQATPVKITSQPSVTAVAVQVELTLKQKVHQALVKLIRDRYDGQVEFRTFSSNSFIKRQDVKALYCTDADRRKEATRSLNKTEVRQLFADMEVAGLGSYDPGSTSFKLS